MKQSLLLRLGMAMAAIFSLAVIGMLSSVFITETAKGFAAAINQAGTLRMQSYRIASSLVHDRSTDSLEAAEITQSLVQEFNQRLFSPRIHDVLEKSPSQRVLLTYAMVERQWKENIHPQLMDYLRLTLDAPGWSEHHQAITSRKSNYLRNVDSFVEDIHYLVEALEIDAEKKNQQLRVIQIISLILVFVVASLSMFLAKTRVMRPLRDLLACANLARRGDFSARSHYLSEDELGQLGHAFNVMAEDLSKLYADLEARVQEKTADLERSNRSLELLYTTTRRLNDASLSEGILQAIIHDIEQLMGASAGSICLGQPGDEQGFRLACTNPLDVARQDRINRHCERCLGKGESHGFQIEREETGSVHVFSTPIRDKSRQYGVLLVEFSHEAELEEWQQLLLETVAHHIALAINVMQQLAQNRMLALLEERSVIARELHDSLAQSLSYLKIQVSRLEKKVVEDGEKEDVLAISSVLRSGLNGAYRQLRELLTTFRLRINEADLGAALEETIKEYAIRGDIPIEFLNRIANCQFGPNAEIHVIQIIREALSNVIRHANASWARVLLECDLDRRVTILIEDDGTGIHEKVDMMQHYGLPIMQERAEWLGGELRISESDGGGTRIKLTFSLVDSGHSDTHENMLQKLSDGLDG